MTWRSASLGFPAGHPAAAGHFPGNPMIPGALLLDAVIAAIAGEYRDSSMRLHAAKFLRIVRPGDTLELRWQAQENGATFECLAAGGLAVTGRLEFKTDP